MRIDIVSDTICPWCFVGKRRLERAIAKRPGLSFEISWRPFQLNPDMPADGMDRDAYMAAKFGGTDQAGRFYQVIDKAGGGEGIDFAFVTMTRVPNTIDSHRLIRWAGSAGVQDAVVEALFREYFLESADIGKPEVLIRVAREAGMDADLVAGLLDGDADKKLVVDEDEMARAMGITGVPCFIIDQKYAVVGANEPSVLLDIFDRAQAEPEDQETAEAEASPEASPGSSSGA